MPRVCSICTHRKRRYIDAAIAKGEPNRRVASHFGVTEISIRRHKPHVAQLLAKAQVQQEARLQMTAEKVLSSMAQNKADLVALKAKEMHKKRPRIDVVIRCIRAISQIDINYARIGLDIRRLQMIELQTQTPDQGGRKPVHPRILEIIEEVTAWDTTQMDSVAPAESSTRNQEPPARRAIMRIGGSG